MDELIKTIINQGGTGLGVIFALGGLVIVLAATVRFTTSFPYISGTARNISRGKGFLSAALIVLGLALFLFDGKNTAKDRVIFPNISGAWEYICKQSGTQYSHGGISKIEQKTTPYGPQWNLQGTRKWVAKKETNFKPTVVDPPFNWQTTWGAITDENLLRFTYTITTPDGTIEGYAWGVIKGEKSKPHTIEGNFYQLPPFQPMFGTFELRRMSNDSDLRWMPSS